MRYEFGIMKKGAKNLITDVPGVKVGHCTVADGDIQSGVTAILPHTGDLFHEKCPAGMHVINGFGKSAGLMQIDEVGNIETPIVLTNTLSVGVAFTAVVRYMVERNAGVGRDEGTVNPVVLECNDGFLSDIRGLHIKEEHVYRAIEAADDTFELGAVGAGRGMSCYGLKGGIGSASRVFECNGQTYTLGALVMTNFGSLKDLMISGDKAGKRLTGGKEETKGSCIMVLATDAPVSSRQLRRICNRAQNGLARTGGITGGGSGEIVVGFSTANRLKTSETVWHPAVFNENALEPLFRAATETVEEGIISSMLNAQTLTGIDGHRRVSLSELI